MHKRKREIREEIRNLIDFDGKTIFEEKGEGEDRGS